MVRAAALEVAADGFSINTIATAFLDFPEYRGGNVSASDKQFYRAYGAHAGFRWPAEPRDLLRAIPGLPRPTRYGTVHFLWRRLELVGASHNIMTSCGSATQVRAPRDQMHVTDHPDEDCEDLIRRTGHHVRAGRLGLHPGPGAGQLGARPHRHRYEAACAPRSVQWAASFGRVKQAGPGWQGSH